MYRRQWLDSRLGFQKVDCLFDVAGGQVELSLLVIRAGYCLLPLRLQGCRDRVWIAVRNLVHDSCPRLRVQISTIKYTSLAYSDNGYTSIPDLF